MATKPQIYKEIDAERDRQDVKWGGPDHDDEHDISDWMGYIHRYTRTGTEKSHDKTTRERLIIIAALAVAAIESHDRITS